MRVVDLITEKNLVDRSPSESVVVGLLRLGACAVTYTTLDGKVKTSLCTLNLGGDIGISAGIARLTSPRYKNGLVAAKLTDRDVWLSFYTDRVSRILLVGEK